MVAHYDDYDGTFKVESWERGRGYVLDLTHEYNYELDEERQEAFVPGWSLGFVWDLGSGIWVLDFPLFLNLLSPYVRILDFSGSLTLLINTLL